MSRSLKDKIIIGSIVCLMVCSVLFILAQNSIAKQDDEDINAVISGTLNADSSEIYSSSLIPTGTYNFFELPELDIANCDHDATRIDVSEIQEATIHNTEAVNSSFKFVEGNQTIISKEIEEYTISPSDDPIITVNITHNTSSFTEWVYLGTSVSVAAQDTAPVEIVWDGTNWWMLGGTNDRVYKYDSNWVYTGTSYSIAAQDGYGEGLFWDGTNWWMLGGTNDRVYKYDSNWIYTGTSYLLSAQDGSPVDIHWDGTNWYMYGDNNYKVYKYDSNWIYTGTSYSVDFPSHNEHGMFWDGVNWWFGTSIGKYIYKYNSNFVNTGVKFTLAEPTYIYDICSNGDVWWMLSASSNTVFKYTSHHVGNNFINHTYVGNFSYYTLGLEYNETIELIYDSINSDPNWGFLGSFIYYLASSQLTYYDQVSDLTILVQNLTLIFDIIYDDIIENISFYVSYPIKISRVPTEIELTINSLSVIDESFNSGFVMLSLYPTTLSITSTFQNIFFILNVTVDFSFNFDLDIISKTYCRKTFELISNHMIEFERLDLDEDLNIKKIYFNNVDKGSSNPCYFVPSVEMSEGNVFYLEVLLAEELYRQLPYKVPDNSYTEDWDDWDLSYNNNYTDSSFSDGNLSSQLEEGNYPATYSFTEDEEKTNYEIDWIDSIAGSVEKKAEVIPSYNNHDSVVNLSCVGTNGLYCYYQHNLGVTYNNKQIFEFWICYEDLGLGTNYIQFRSNLNSNLFVLSIYHNTNQLLLSAKTSVTLSFYPNQWTHIKAVFDCDTDKVSCWVNNTLKIDNTNFQSDRITTNIASTLWYFYSFGNPMRLYMDAWGESKDQNYAIGDNLYYENYMGTHDFEQYNQSTNADYTGTHSFDTTTQGYYYMGTKDFNNEIIGTTGLNIDWINSFDTTTPTTIITNKLGHNNTLYLENGRVRHDFSTKYTSLTIEFWSLVPDNTKNIAFILKEDNTENLIIHICHNDGKFEYRANGGSYVEVAPVYNNVWVHHRIYINSTGKFDWYINGTLVVNDVLLYSAMISGINKVQLYSQDVSHILYIDAIGCQADDSYYKTSLNRNPYDIRPLLTTDIMYGGNTYLASCSTKYNISVESSIAGHKNVLKIEKKDNLAVAGNDITYLPYYSPTAIATSGTVEFYWRVDQKNSDYLFFYFYDSVGVSFIKMVLNYGSAIKYYNNTSQYETLYSHNANQWYHIRVDFDSNSDTFDFYIDGVLIKDNEPYTAVAGGISKLIITGSYDLQTYYIHYFDSFDFSWSPNYVQYRNTNQYYKDLIDTNFDDDWTMTYAPNCSIGINSDYNTHKKYLELFDNSTAPYTNIYKSFPNQAYGTIEFYMKSSDTSYSHSIRIMYVGTTVFMIKIDSDKFQYYDGTWHDVGLSASDNVWYLIRIDFECTGGLYEGLSQYKWNLYINSIKWSGTGYSFASNQPYTNRFDLVENTNQKNYYKYIDSLSFSWEDSIGINLLKEMPEIENPYATINKTIDFEFLNSFDSYNQHCLKQYDITISFNYRYTEWGDYLNTTIFNYSTNLIDDNAWHYYSLSFTFDSEIYDYFELQFNISNGQLLFTDFSYSIEFYTDKFQLTQNPITTINSVEFAEYLEADRNFGFWYYRNVLDINDLSITQIDTEIITSTFEFEVNKYYFEQSASTNDEFNATVDYMPNWDVDVSYTKNTKDQVIIKVDYKADLSVSDVDMVLDLRNSNIFLDDENQNRIELIITLENIEFTSSYQTLYINGNRTQYTTEPRSNLNSTQLTEIFKYGSQVFSSIVSVDPTWYVDYDVIENNGTYSKLKVFNSAIYSLTDVDLILDLLTDNIYNENWTLNATQSLITFKLTIPNVSFTSIVSEFYIEGSSSVPNCTFNSFTNEEGFKLSDEEWKIKISDKEWRKIKGSNWKDLEVHMVGYLSLPKFSKTFIISDIDPEWELDGVHYGNNFYDVSDIGYFSCEGFGSGITSVYLKFKTNPIEDLEREQQPGEVTYKIKSKYNLEDVDFIFYIEEKDNYNKKNMIKDLKKEIDCDDIIEYYEIEDRIYYMIVNMDLDEGTNEIVIKYKVESMVAYSWILIVVGIAMIGFGVLYVSLRYKDNNIRDYIGLDKIVKCFFWIKKSYRERLLKKNRYKTKKGKKIRKSKIK